MGIQSSTAAYLVATIAPGTVIGEDADADRERGFRVTDSGLTLVTPDMLGQHLHFTR